MAKKQFVLDDWLKDKSQKVVTRCGFPVRIVCTDVKRKDYPILALVERDDQEEYQSFTKDGRFSLYNPLHDNFDLFIETADEVCEDEKIRKRITLCLEECVHSDVIRDYEKDECAAWLEKQKPAEWSEEDEHRIEDTVYFLDTAKKHYASTKELDACIAWLESLKGRVRPQNRWKPSELQLGCLSDAIEHYNSLGYPAPKLKELLDDLKKLKGEV